MISIIQNKVLIIIMAILFIILLIFLLTRGRGEGILQSDEDYLVKINHEGKELTVYGNNTVTLITENGRVYSEIWEEDKVNELLLYLQYQDEEIDGETTLYYSDGTTKKVNGSEIIDLVEDDVTSGTESNPTPTPIATSGGGSGGVTTPTPAPWQRPPGCTYWRLNYCADRPATPTPISSPVSGEVPYEFNCELDDRMVSTRTIISNTLCIGTPSPTPTSN